MSPINVVVFVVTGALAGCVMQPCPSFSCTYNPEYMLDPRGQCVEVSRDSLNRINGFARVPQEKCERPR